MYSIREAATRNLMKLAQEFGPDWARIHLVPQVSCMWSRELCVWVREAIACNLIKLAQEFGPE